MLSKRLLLILVALISGFGLVGMIVMLVNLYAAFILGATEGIDTLIVVFLFGASVGAGILWSIMKRLEGDVLKKLGLDE